MSLTLVKKPEYEFGDGLFSRWNAIHQQEGVKFEYQRKDFAITGWVDNAGQLKITISSTTGLLAEKFVYLYDDSGIYTPGFYKIDAVDDGTHLTLVLAWNGEGSDGFINSEDKFPNYNVLAEIYTIKESVIGKNLLTNGDFSIWDADDPKYWTVAGESGTDPEVSEVGANEGHGGAGTGSCNIYSTSVIINIFQNIMTVGKVYLFEIEITKIILNDIAFKIGDGDVWRTISSEGVHKYILICKGNGYLYIKRNITTCDVTIDNVSVREIGSFNQLIFTPDTTGLVKVDSVSALKMVSSFAESSLYDIVNIRDANASGRFEVRVKEQWTGSSESWGSYSDTFYHTNTARQLKDKYGKNMFEYILKQKAIDRKILSIYDTNERGEADEVVKPNASFGPMIYWYNNKSYGCWEQRGGAGYCCESMVYAIYHKECFISESYGVGPPRSAQSDCGSDPHAVPVIIVADDKHIVVAHERLTGPAYPPYSHNGYLQIKRSDNSEDETSWINARAHIGNYFDEKGDEVDNRLSYPSFDKLLNSKLFLFCRHFPDADDTLYVSVHRSDDHGVSWNALGGGIDGGYDVVGPINPLCDPPALIYKGLCKHPYDNNLYLMVWWYDLTDTFYPDLYFLKCTDGLGKTCQSVDGAHSQDITAGGGTPITKAILDTPANHYLVKHTIKPERITPIDGIITDTGIPYIVAFKGNTGVYDLFMYYWNGAAWIETEMGFSNSGGCILFQRGDVLEIIVAKVQNGTFKRNIYRSPDLTTLNNWILIKEIYEDDNDIFIKNRSVGTFNYTVTDCEAFAAMTNRNVGAYSDIYLYADMCAAATKFLTKFINPKRFINYPWDISIIYSELLLGETLILKETHLDINMDDGELIVGWHAVGTHNNWDIFTSSGTKIISAIESLPNTGKLALSKSCISEPDLVGFSVIIDEMINITCTVNLNSGTLPQIGIVEPPSYTPISNIVRLIAGVNNIDLTITESSDIAWVLIYCPEDEEVDFATTSNIIVKRIRSTNLDNGEIEYINRIVPQNAVGAADAYTKIEILRDNTPDVLISESKIIKNDQDCKDNPVYLRWVNLLGGREYWLFSHHQEYPLEIYDIKLIERNISNIETAEAIQDIISKEAKESIIIGEDNLPVSNVDGMKGLLLSPLVQMLTNPASWESEGPKWKTMIVKKNTWNLYRNDRGTYSLELEIGLPRLNIQTR